jgi:hypothetical protein
MRPLYQVRSLLFSAVLIGVGTLAARPGLAADAEVSAQLSYVSGIPGSEVFRYDYTVKNLNVTPDIHGFLIFFDSDPATQVFDGSDDADFVSATGPDANWTVDVFEGPDPDAWFVEFGNYVTAGTVPGDEVGTFSVEFLWKNADALPPCDQFFEVLNGRAHEGVSTTKVLTTTPRNGVIQGQVLDCNGLPIEGVTVDLFQNDNLILSVLTNSFGNYVFGAVGPGSYTVNVVTPIGFTIEEELPNSCRDGSSLDFALDCQTTEYDPRTIGFWKHQANVHITGKGKAQVTKTQLVSYLDAIYDHFAQNPVHPVLVYTLPPATTALTKLNTAQDILTVSGGASMELRARQQLMALLLNVASLKLGQSLVISPDGSTVNQAITYAWDLIADGDPANDETAKTIADELNNGHTLAAGIIPAATPVILYSQPGIVTPPVENAAFRLGQNYPNPVTLSTRIPFAVPAGVGSARVEVQVFDMTGRLVKTLLSESKVQGDYETTWDGTNESGQSVSSGVYFYRLIAGSFSETKKLQILK